MKITHTPAPWFAVDYAGSYCIQDGPDYTDKDIISYDSMFNPEINEVKKVVEKNIQLICAAPELLSICMRILKDDEDHAVLRGEDRVKLKNAIKKATE